MSPEGAMRRSACAHWVAVALCLRPARIAGYSCEPTAEQTQLRPVIRVQWSIETFSRAWRGPGSRLVALGRGPASATIIELGGNEDAACWRRHARRTPVPRTARSSSPGSPRSRRSATASPTRRPSRRPGRIVAFTVGLSALSDQPHHAAQATSSSSTTYGGTTQVAITVLTPVWRQEAAPVEGRRHRARSSTSSRISARWSSSRSDPLPVSAATWSR